MDRREARVECVKVLLGMGYEWLARDKDGTALAYDKKPFKIDDDEWNFDDGCQYLYLDNSDDINFVKWEDDEPVNIREWLEKEEEEMKMYSVKDGELECREVDADFFEKNTTLGGLLTPRELDRDNNIIPDDATIKVAEKFREGLKAGIDYGYEPSVSIVADQDDCGESTPASLVRTPASLVTSDEVELDQDDRKVAEGATIKVTAEKAKEIREALEMATDYGYKPSVSIVDDNYTLKTNGQILDVASMYPPRQLSLADLDNVKVHDRICLELNNIYEKKNADYGNSFENSLDKHGLIAGIVRMDDKMSRLISLNSKNEQQVMDESLRDTLMDLANYAIMSVMWLDEQ